MKSLQADINELTVALDKRKRHYKLTESYFVTYMKYSFKKILEFRQFKVSNCFFDTNNINMLEYYVYLNNGINEMAENIGIFVLKN